MAKFGLSPVTRERESPRATTMSSLHLLDLVLDVEDLAFGTVGLYRDVERNDQSALEVHLVDHVADLLEHLLVGHDHLLAEGPAHLE